MMERGMLARVFGRVNSHTIAVLMKSYKSHVIVRAHESYVVMASRKNCDGFVIGTLISLTLHGIAS
jgi:hypothetical protein